MIFETLDAKSECAGYYQNGELYFNDPPKDMSATWDFSWGLKGLDIQYAYIYAGGKTLDECCPEHLKLDWGRVQHKMKAFISSFIESKVSLKENCIFDLVPGRYLKEYYDVRCKIIEHVLKTYKKPSQYDFYREFNEFIACIYSRELCLNKAWLTDKLWDTQAKRLWEKINKGHTKIDYNLFGSVTGRLTVTDNSFPILSLNKKLRNVIKPKNNWLVELDLNAAELRISQALLNKTQVEGDLHEWSADNIFKGELSRAEAKETATTWLYNSHNKLALKYNTQLEQFYNRPALKALYWADGFIQTPFGRHIACDEHHSISYLNQSTLIDMFHRQILKMNILLNEKKSFISFLVHDCLVVDLAEEDRELLPKLIKTLSDTQFGIFPVNVKIGQNYGSMKKVKIKA